MGTILVYEMKKDRERELKDLARVLGHQMKTVNVSSYGESLGYMAGISGFPRLAGKDSQELLGSEMLVFSGLDGNSVDIFLSAMKERNFSVALKAILTPYNVRWNSRQLYEELVKEHKNMA